MKERIYKVYVHKVDTEDGPMYYTGVTCQKVWQRWKPSCYKNSGHGKCSLWPYIEKYGWDTIEHVVVYETNNREEAMKIEDMLICGYSALGMRINERRSGHIWLTDKNAYARNQRANNPKYAEHQLQYERDKRANDPEWVERQRQYDSKRRTKPERKIYIRVYHFNESHPDLAVESPKEARDKYLTAGYIPDYIKHDDL